MGKRRNVLASVLHSVVWLPLSVNVDIRYIGFIRFQTKKTFALTLCCRAVSGQQNVRESHLKSVFYGVLLAATITFNGS